MQDQSDDEMPELHPQWLFQDAIPAAAQLEGAFSYIFSLTPPPMLPPSPLMPPPLPMLPQPQLFLNLNNHIPAQIVSCAWFSTREHCGARGRAVHPLNPHRLWCTKSGHWVPSDIFGLQMQVCTLISIEWKTGIKQAPHYVGEALTYKHILSFSQIL
jgi:hypothetical protein